MSFVLVENRWEFFCKNCHHCTSKKVTVKAISAKEWSNLVWKIGRGIFSRKGKYVQLERFDIYERNHNKKTKRNINPKSIP